MPEPRHVCDCILRPCQGPNQGVAANRAPQRAGCGSARCITSMPLHKRNPLPDPSLQQHLHSLQADSEQAVQDELAAGRAFSAAAGARASSEQRPDGAGCAMPSGDVDESTGAPACRTVAGEPVVLCSGLQREQGRLGADGRAHYFSKDDRDMGLAGQLVRLSALRQHAVAVRNGLRPVRQILERTACLASAASAICDMLAATIAHLPNRNPMLCADAAREAEPVLKVAISS